MNEKAKTLLKNLNYTVSANFLVLGISVILNLVVPKFIGVKEYSFWQLYVFYSSYVGFFHFGWLDGIYLKIGGAEYEDLDKRSLGTQFWYLLGTQVVLASILIVYAVFFASVGDRKIILLFTSLNLIVSNCKNFVLYILQSTNRIKEYAQISRSDRYLYIIGVIVYLIIGGYSFIPLIILDFGTKIVVLLWGLAKIKDLLFNKLLSLNDAILEVKDNIKIGSNLMLSNIASMLVLGISRKMVERKWSIETFGKLSFTLSISNMFMTFINAVGIVMFPLLRRTKKENLPTLYINIRNVFVPITYGFLLFFAPIKGVLTIWLPEYTQSLLFMGILFPMVIYEGRMALLVSTYLKTIRKEKLILFSNVITLFISSFLSFISVFIVQDIYVVVIVIMFALAFRCIFAEIQLLKVMNLNFTNNIILETLLTIVFILANIFVTEGASFIIYIIAFSLYLILSKSAIHDSSKVLIDMMKG